MDILNVNIMRHGDGKRVYISVKTDNLEFVVATDHIHVNIDGNLPDPLRNESPVTVWQDGK